jgi:hypothetical protein
MLLSFRFVQAAGASCAQRQVRALECLVFILICMLASVGLGIIADIYMPAERGRATGWSVGSLVM